MKSLPAFAASGSASALTVTVTLSVADNPPESVTVNVKVRLASAESCGATKDGAEVFAPRSVTDGVPPVCVHAYVSAPFSGSELPLPSSVAVSPSLMAKSLPASAVGAALPSFTVTVTVSVADNPPGSVTVSVNVNAVFAVTCGAVKVGEDVDAPVNATVGVPPVCAHA